MIETLNMKVKTNQKKLTSKKKKKARAVKAQSKVNKNQTPKENIDFTPPPPQVVSAIVSRPPTPMVKFASDSALYPMYGSPVQQSMQQTIQQFPSNGQQYVSPAFARRNYARWNI